MSDKQRTVLVVPLPELDGRLAALRSAWIGTRPASEVAGLPAHITVLGPFLSMSRIDDAVLSDIADVAARAKPFNLVFRDTGWFADGTLYLRPHPARSLHRLTDDLIQAFPACEPYPKAYVDVIHHLTVADRGYIARLRSAEVILNEHLPWAARADRLCLWGVPTNGRRVASVYHPVAEFPLG